MIFLYFLSFFFPLFLSKRVYGTVDVDLNCKKNIFEKEGGVAYGFFENSFSEQGWDTFVVHTNENFNDSIQAEAAGYLEGCLQAEAIDYLIALGKQNYGYPPPQKMVDFVEDNFDFITKRANSSSIFENANLILKQMEGMTHSWNIYSKLEPHYDLSVYEFAIYILADSSDIVKIVQEEEGDELSSDDDSFYLEDRCSSIITLLPNHTDLFFSHSTWLPYNTMKLQYKKYDLHFQNEDISSKEILQMGWPGCIDSGMHFMISETLLITETSLNVFNSSLMKDTMSPDTILTSFRSILAARMANTTSDWISIFSQFNSGSFPNQWYIVDYLSIIEQEEEVLSEMTAILLEQMPFTILWKDVTNNLTNDGYLGGYNVAYFEEIREISGLNIFLSQHPEKEFMFSFDEAPRAQIMKRDHHLIQDIDTAKQAIRYDDWRNDPLSKDYPIYVTCSRYEFRNDTTDPEGLCFGGLDAKVMSLREFQNQNKTLHFIVSPPHTNDPIFQWRGSVCESIWHEDLGNDVWGFDWVKFSAEDEGTDHTNGSIQTKSQSSSMIMFFLLCFTAIFIFF